jgi:hypothetical protein
MALLETCLCCSLLVASAVAGIYALVNYEKFVIRYLGMGCFIPSFTNIIFNALNSK